MQAFGNRTLLLLLLASSWLGACRHTARSKAKSFVRLEKSLLENGDWVNKIPPAAEGYANICSFNIQVLGKYKERQKLETQLMAEALAPCALVVVQEITAPPTAMEFANGDTLEGDPETRLLFDALTQPSIGFAYLMSPEDTGRWINHSDSGGSEFFAFFYRPDVITPADWSGNGFLQSTLRGSKVCAKDQVNENTWDRVPFAQLFRFSDGGSDFVVINNHLHSIGRRPCVEASETPMMALSRRAAELGEIQKWIQANKKPGGEKDFLIVGDMNLTAVELELIQNGELPSEGDYELRSSYYDDVKANYQSIYESGYRSLNSRCVPTNTTARSCLDNALFNPEATANIGEEEQIQVLNLKGYVRAAGYCESKPTVCSETDSTFSRYFSDHNPIFFTWKISEDED